MPAVIPAIAEFAAYEAAGAELTALGAGSLGATVGAALVAAAVGYETSRLLGLNAGPDLKSSTAAGAQIDAVGTYSAIPVLYGSRRVGCIRVLTETESSSVSTLFEGISATTSYTVLNSGAAFVADLGVTGLVDGPDGSFNPFTFTKVGSSPGDGQYAVTSGGTYTFNAGDRNMFNGVTIVYQANVTNDQLHLVVVWGMGQINAVTQIYLDDVPITDPSFAGLAYFENYVGTDTQAASAALISALGGKWTAAHQLRGLAYSYIRLQWSAGVFPRGKPNITADVQGKLVFDPRSSTTVFSNNPWLCVRDYLTSTRYGWKVPAAMMDDASFIAAANYAEQRITAPTFVSTVVADPVADTMTFAAPPGVGFGDGLQFSTSGTLSAPLVAATTYYAFQVADPPGTTSPPGTTYKLATSIANALAGVTIDLTTAGSGVITASFFDLQRYTCDGILDIDQRRLGNMNALLSACRGFLVFSGGLYRARSEAVTSPVSFTLTEDNIVGGWSIQLPQRRTQYNRMRGNFFDAANLWQSNVAVQDSTVYRALDGGALYEASIDLPFTTNVYRANELAMMELKQSRFGIGVTLRATIAALQLEVGDVVPVTHATPGWVSQLFRVMSIELLPNDEISMVLTQYDPSVYTLDPFSYFAPSPATNLPGQVQLPGAPVVIEDLYSTTGSAGVKSRALVTWAGSSDIFVRDGGYYELGVSPTRQNDWSTVSHIVRFSFELDDMTPGIYDFRLAAINTLGMKSPYQITTKELIGLSAPPSDIMNFAVQSYSGQAKFTWDKLSSNTDLDVTIGGRIFVRYSPKTVGATWNDGTLVNPDGYPGDTSIGFGPLTTGTYMAKAMDSSGNFSVNAASFIVTEAVLVALTTIATVTESPAFTGAKTNVANIGAAIQLDSATSIDGMLTLIDSWGAIDSLGGVQGSGSYAFASKLDLGSVTPARLVANIDSNAFDIDDLIDSRTDPIDSWGLMDGGVIEDADVLLMVRSTNDDPNASPAWGPWHALGQVGDYNNRGFDFRLDFATGNSTHNRRVTTLAVAAKH